MKTLRTTLFLSLTAATFFVSTEAYAQRAPSGFGGYASVLFPSSDLGGGAFTGGGVDGVWGLSPRISLLLSGGMYRNAITEEGGLREYNLYTPSIGIRGNLVGDRSDLALLLAAGSDVYDLKGMQQQGAGSEDQTRVIPSLSAGLEVRFPVYRSLNFQASARNRMHYVRESELFGNPGDSRKLSHSPELRLGLSILFRPRESLEMAMAKQPPQFTAGMRPIEASSVIFEPVATNQGRDHMHVGDDGEARRIEVVDAEVFGGERSASGSVLVDVGPLSPSTEQLLGSVYFDLGSFQVKKDYDTLLRDVALFLNQNPAARLEMYGYTDSRGGGVMNLSLAEQRGTALQELLVRLYGVAPERIRVSSKGIDYRAEEANVARRVDLVARIPVR